MQLGHEQRSGGQLLVDQLMRHGVREVTTVPGESFLPVLDALRGTPAIRLMVCRHEGAAAHMAEAYGRLTGTPGVCIVTRAPGATHASVGVHTAMQGSTPMVLLVGQVSTDVRGRGTFQETDLAAMFRPLAKWTASIDSADRIPEVIASAFAVAASGRPGPVVVALPENVLSDTAAAVDAGPYPVVRPEASADQVQYLYDELAGATRPLLVLGRGSWTRSASRDIASFAERNNIPVLAAFRCQDQIDNSMAPYVGHLGLAREPVAERVAQDADAIVLIGGALSDTETRGYTLFGFPNMQARLVHVHPDPAELSRGHVPDRAIVSTPEALAAELVDMPALPKATWQGWASKARAEYAEWSDGTQDPNDQVAALVRTMNETLPADAIVTNGAGNYTVWLHRFFRYRSYGTQLAPVSGAMGYGLPAAIMAKRLHPDRAVVALAGDGCFMMSLSDLATAAQYGLGIVVVIVNNGMYGTIRLHQERTFPERVYATDLENPDFVALAKSFGANAVRVERIEDFSSAIMEGVVAAGPTVIEMRTVRDLLVPGVTVSGLRAGHPSSQETDFASP